MSEFDVAAYLASKNLRGKPASGGREITYPCFFDCAEPADSRKRKLYIQAADGFYHCLSGETKVVTRHGRVAIRDLAGGEHELVTTGGKWVKAPVLHFGQQPVHDVVLTRQRRGKTVRATDEHRWITREGKVVFTKDLKPGMRLASAIPERSGWVVDPEGVQHGIVFGDGSRRRKSGPSFVRLHGRKQELARFFAKRYVASDVMTRCSGLPRHYKDLPSLDSLDYLAGWVAGYIATDGTIAKHGHLSVDSNTIEHLEFLKDACAVLGIATGVIGSYWHDGGALMNGRRHLSHKLTLMDVPPELLIRADQRERWRKAKYVVQSWRVVEVGPKLPPEDVYCAVVGGTEAFLLEDHLLTGNCKVCGVSGGSWTLQKHFGDEPRAGTNDDAFMRRRILDAAVQVGIDMLNNNDSVELYLLERGLSSKTITERKLGFVAGGWSLVGTLPEDVTAEQVATTGLVTREGPRAGKDFFYRHLLIPYLARGHCIQMRGRAWGDIKGGKYLTGPGEPPRVYNSESLDGAEEVIITEGEFDTMILAQTLAEAPEERARRIAVIALPGTSAIPEELDDLLVEVKRIYIGFDSDDAGKKAAESLKERLGQRCRILTLPYEDGRKCDWTEYLLPEQSGHLKHEHPYAGHTWRDVLRLLSSAAGKRIYSVAEAGEAFRAYREEHDGLLTGYTDLDAAIRPGLMPGQVVVVLAKTGTGKTVFLCNLAINMLEHKILFVSLEMTREEVYDRLQRIYLFHHPDCTTRDVDTALSNIYICDENRLGSKDLSALANEFAVEADAPPLVVMVDYLGYYARGFPGNSPYEKVGNAVMELKAEAKAGRYVLIAPAQVNRGAKEGKPIDLDDARDAGQVEETADFLLALFRPDEAISAQTLANGGVEPPKPPSGRINLAILKSRHGGRGTQCALQMDLLTLAVVNDMTAAARRAVDHNYLAFRGHEWADLRRAETRPRQSTLEGMPRGKH